MLSDLRDDCTFDPVLAAQLAQGIGGGGRRRRRRTRCWIGQRGTRGGTFAGSRRNSNRKPSGDLVVPAVLGDDRGRIPLRVGGGVTAEEAFDGLLPGSEVGREVAVDIDEGAEELGVLHGEVDRAGPSRRPSDDAPVGRVIADAEIRHHVRHDVLGEIVARVAPSAVDTLGDFVERAAGVGEYEDRCVAAVPGGELIDGLDGVGSADPIRRSVELAADHHHRG